MLVSIAGPVTAKDNKEGLDLYDSLVQMTVKTLGGGGYWGQINGYFEGSYPQDKEKNKGIKSPCISAAASLNKSIQYPI